MHMDIQGQLLRLHNAPVHTETVVTAAQCTYTHRDSCYGCTMHLGRQGQLIRLIRLLNAPVCAISCSTRYLSYYRSVGETSSGVVFTCSCDSSCNRNVAENVHIYVLMGREG